MCATHASRSTMLHAKERECSKGLIFRSYAKENQPTRNQHIIRKDGYGIDANCNHAAGARTSTLSFDRFEFGDLLTITMVRKKLFLFATRGGATNGCVRDACKSIHHVAR